MGIIVTWDNDAQTVLRYTYSGEWTWDEFYEVVGKGNAMIETVSHPVVSLVDMHDTDHIPTNAITNIRRIVDLSAQTRNTNISVFVGTNQFGEMLVETAKRIYRDIELKATFHFVGDLETGRQLALEIQAGLAASAPDQQAS